MADSWAGVYLQVVAAILIFGVGFPALAMQSIVSEDVRGIVHRYRRGYRWVAGLVAVFGGVTVFFIWIQQPALAGVSGGMAWIAGGLLTIAVLGMGAFWLAQVQYRRDRVINFLLGMCKSQLVDSGIPNERVVADLGILGAHCTDPEEPIMVMDGLCEIAVGAITHRNYRGASLTELLDTVALVATSYSDLRVLFRGTGLLRTIMEHLERQEHLQLQSGPRRIKYVSSPDALKTLAVLRVVSAYALRLEGGGAVVSSSLQQLTEIGSNWSEVFETASLTLFQIGRVALSEDCPKLAIEVLDKMETLVDAHSPLQRKKAADYLGLVAHFWSAGPSYRLRAKEGLSRRNLRRSLRSSLRWAREYQAEQAEFGTADELRRLEKALEGKRQRRAAKPEPTSLPTVEIEPFSHEQP